MTLIKAYKVQTQIEGLTKDVLISIECEHEDLETDYMELEDIEQIKKDLVDQKISCLWVKVSARFKDLSHFEGQDTLGQVIVRSSESQKDLLETINSHEMVENAILYLKEQVLQGVQDLNNFLGKVS